MYGLRIEVKLQLGKRKWYSTKLILRIDKYKTIIYK